MSLLLRTALAAGLVSLLSTTVHASDGFVPRTPVLWEDVPCLERVDRSDDPVLHLPYAIPNEDTDLTEDEVEDSRTHQFFAFCRRQHPLEHPPNWISWADVDAAVAAGMLESADDVDPETVLESSTVWAGCWSRITADDERRPIVQSMADQGIDWDTTGLEPGGYTIYGYTYHPPLNPWHIRPGVVKVHDGDPDAAGPTAATFLRDDPDVLVYNGGTVSIEGCVDSATPATVSGYYALAQSGEPGWVPFVEGQPIDGDTFLIELVAAADMAGTSSMIRIDVEDPAVRKQTTYMDEIVIVLEGTDPNSCEDSGGFIAGPECDDEGGASTGADDDDSTSGSATDGVGDATDTQDDSPEQAGEAGGCGCTAPAGMPGASALWVLGLLAVRRGSTLARAR
jgi:hypothetical protein